MSTITERFSHAFDPKDKSHVVWLKSLHTATQEKKNIDLIFVGNPMRVSVKSHELLEWINVQFILCMKYAHAVLEEKAWVPGNLGTVRI